MNSENILILLSGILCGAAFTWIINNKKISKMQFLEEENIRLQKFETETRDLLQKNSSLETELASERKNLERMQKELSDHFEAISSKVSQQSQKSFLELAEQTFKRLQDGAKKDQELHGAAMQGLVEPMKNDLESLQKVISEIEKQRVGSFSELVQNISLIREDSEKLRYVTNTLAKTLGSGKDRGRWGEFHLQKALEDAGMLEGVDFVQQTALDESKRPDFTIRLPDNRSIIIDSKVPLDAFMEANREGISDEERDRCLKRYAEHVKGHIKSLNSKAYWESLDSSPEFVLMYMPSDSYYAAALKQDATLFETGINSKVFIMTPSTLMPTLFVIKHAWKQEKLASNAKEISNLGAELYKRLCTFSEHFDRMRKGLNSALENYDKAVGSFEKQVIPSARKFRDLQSITSDESLIAPESIGSEPRRLSISERESDNV